MGVIANEREMQRILQRRHVQRVASSSIGRGPLVGALDPHIHRWQWQSGYRTRDGPAYGLSLGLGSGWWLLGAADLRREQPEKRDDTAPGSHSETSRLAGTEQRGDGEMRRGNTCCVYSTAAGEAPRQRRRKFATDSSWGRPQTRVRVSCSFIEL